MKPRKRKLYTVSYNSSEEIGDSYQTEDLKLALAFYKTLIKNTKRQHYEILKKAEKRGDWISLGVSIDEGDSEINYKTIYRKEIKA